MQRFLTDDEITDAKALVNWQFWATPAVFGVASVAAGIGALADQEIIFLFLPSCALALLACIFRIRDYNKMRHDIEMRIVEVLEGAPEKVWAAASLIELTKLGFCYVRLGGRAIRIPSDTYGELREATMVKVAFLPTALAAVRVETVRGIAL